LTAPATLEFGRQVTGRTSSEHAVEVTATGTDPTTISAVELSGANASDFAIGTDTCTGAVLSPSATCSIGVRFTPGDLSSRDTGLVVHADIAAGSITVKPEGIGVDSSLSPLTLDIGSVPLGASSSGVVTLSNGLEAQSIDGFTISWAGESTTNPFSIRPASGCTALTTIPALGACDITIDYSPKVAAGDYATLRGTLGGFRPTDEVSIYGTGLASTNVAWGSVRTLQGPAWTTGNGLARSTQGTASNLHAVSALDYIGGRFANDNSPRVGIYYRRSTNGGATWWTSVRLNPSTSHAARGAIAAYGSGTYGFYVTQTRWVRYSRTAPRILYVRTNGNYGRGAWGTPKRLTSTTGRVDYPSAAAYGSYVYVAYTDATTGSVRIARSRDRGHTFSTKTLGTTTATLTDGRAGLPSVATFGPLVVVAWTADKSGKVLASVSRNYGATWLRNTLATTASGSASAAASSGRLSVAWPTASGVSVRTWVPFRWGPVVSVAPPVIPGAYSWFDTAAIALRGTSQSGVAWSACRAACTSGRPTLDLVWSESTDAGASFEHANVIVDGTRGGGVYPQNFSPSVVWGSPTQRYVMHSAQYYGETYAVQFRSGIGVP